MSSSTIYAISLKWLNDITMYYILDIFFFIKHKVKYLNSEEEKNVKNVVRCYITQPYQRNFIDCRG